MKRKDARFEGVYAGPEMMDRRFLKPAPAAEPEPKKQLLCPSCGADAPEGSRYCPMCGFPLKPEPKPSLPIPQPFVTYAGPPVNNQGQGGAFAGGFARTPYPMNYQDDPADPRTVYAGPPVDVYAGPPIEPDEDE